MWGNILSHIGVHHTCSVFVPHPCSCFLCQGCHRMSVVGVSFFRLPGNPSCSCALVQYFTPGVRFVRTFSAKKHWGCRCVEHVHSWTCSSEICTVPICAPSTQRGTCCLRIWGSLVGPWCACWLLQGFYWVGPSVPMPQRSQPSWQQYAGGGH